MSAEIMDGETLAMAAGALLSLAFSYLPGVQSWYQALTDTNKRLVMLALLVVVAAGAFGLSCLGWGEIFGLGGENLPLTCDAPGAAGLFRALILAVLANQGTYLISPKMSLARTLRRVS
jgi:hypothetical protein